MRTHPGGSRGLDDYFTRDFARDIGAEIMGCNKFGPQRGPWQGDDWRGWLGGEEPGTSGSAAGASPSGSSSTPASSTPCD
ncbi:hypothetical protein RKD18_007950 [Streptomyces phaeoluteigriseus]